MKGFKKSGLDRLANDERGVSTFELTVVSLVFILVLAAGVPSLEVAVEERLEDGRSYWEPFHVDLSGEDPPLPPDPCDSHHPDYLDGCVAAPM